MSIDLDGLRPGASNPELDAELYGIGQAQAARLAERILATPDVEHAQRRADLERARLGARTLTNEGHPLQGLDRGHASDG